MELSICEDYGIPHSEFLSWDSDDQDKVIAYRVWKNQHCPRCGTDRKKWEKDPHAYDAEMRECRGCAKQQLLDKDPTKREGSYVVLVET